MEAAGESLDLSPFQADVGDADQVHRAALSTCLSFGHVDLLINNAAIIIVKPIDETSVQEWDRVLSTNLRSAFLLCRELIPDMKTRGRGLIVNVSSRSGTEGFVGESAYCPSKFRPRGPDQNAGAGTPPLEHMGCHRQPRHGDANPNVDDHLYERAASPLARP